MYLYEVEDKLKSTKNITKNIDSYIEKAREYVDIPPEAIYHIVLSLVEAVNNAAEHGNGFDPEKFVHLHIVADNNMIRMSVRDEGPGYEPDFEAAEARINSEVNKYADRGRGLFLIKKLMHEVETDISNGTELIMTFYFARGINC